MPDSLLYHDGNRVWQDAFDSRPLADRMEARLAHTDFSDPDKAFIEGTLFFFLATADAEGRPDCSFKGGMPGFVRITGPGELTFPVYEGNGMFKSLGNIQVNPHVGLLFIDMGEKPRRMRVNGTAEIVRDEKLVAEFVGAQLLVRVTTRVIFPNCPRYIPEPVSRMPSEYAPRPDYQPPEPAWKSNPDWKDVVPPRRE